MIIPTQQISIEQMIAGYRAEMITPLTEQARQLSEYHLDNHVDAITYDLYLLREEADQHFKKLYEDVLRGETKIDPEFQRRLAKYPISCCLEITRYVLHLLNREVFSRQSDGMLALRKYGQNGGFIKRIWGELRGTYFQNAIQAGGYYVDVANDTVDPKKSKIEILPLTKSGFLNVGSYQRYATIAQPYWDCQMIPNVFFRNLAPFFPIVCIHKDGNTYLESNSIYMFPMNIENKFRLAVDFIFNTRPQSEHFHSCRNHLIRLMSTTNNLGNSQFLHFNSDRDEAGLISSFETYQNMNPIELQSTVNAVVKTNRHLGRLALTQ